MKRWLVKSVETSTKRSGLREWWFSGWKIRCEISGKGKPVLVDAATDY
jgi:hypothetical protein